MILLFSCTFNEKIREVVLTTLNNLLKSERNFIKESFEKKLTSMNWDDILVLVVKTTESLKWNDYSFFENKKEKRSWLPRKEML